MAVEGIETLFGIYQLAVSPMLGQPAKPGPYVSLALGEIATLVSQRIERLITSNRSSGCWVSADRRIIVCYGCGLISHNPRDVDECYCGRCHVFHSDDPGASFPVHRQAAAR